MVTIAMEQMQQKRVISIQIPFDQKIVSINFFLSVFDWSPKDMQRYSDISNSTIIVVDWGFAGLSCYGYIQITLCIIGKVAEFFAFLLSKCVIIEELELIGHSIGKV